MIPREANECQPDRPVIRRSTLATDFSAAGLHPGEEPGTLVLPLLPLVLGSNSVFTRLNDLPLGPRASPPSFHPGSLLDLQSGDYRYLSSEGHSAAGREAVEPRPPRP